MIPDLMKSNSYPVAFDKQLANVYSIAPPQDLLELISILTTKETPTVPNSWLPNAEDDFYYGELQIWQQIANVWLGCPGQHNYPQIFNCYRPVIELSAEGAACVSMQSICSVCHRLVAEHVQATNVLLVSESKSGDIKVTIQ